MTWWQPSENIQLLCERPNSVPGTFASAKEELGCVLHSIKKTAMQESLTVLGWHWHVSKLGLLPPTVQALANSLLPKSNPPSPLLLFLFSLPGMASPLSSLPVKFLSIRQSQGQTPPSSGVFRNSLCGEILFFRNPQPFHILYFFVSTSTSPYPWMENKHVEGCRPLPLLLILRLRERHTAITFNAWWINSPPHQWGITSIP